jgi:copper(I)-binding protein
MHRFSILLIIGVFILLGVSACQQAGAKTIVLEEVWGRPSPKAAENGAIYMRIRNTGHQPDRLVGAESPACGMTELHESVMDAQGVMTMQPVSSITVPAGGEVELKVGGLHVMCMHKRDTFQPGARIPLTLHFEKAGAITLEVAIRQQ